jgi:hypothetical protein
LFNFSRSSESNAGAITQRVPQEGHVLSSGRAGPNAGEIACIHIPNRINIAAENPNIFNNTHGGFLPPCAFSERAKTPRRVRPCNT